MGVPKKQGTGADAAPKVAPQDVKQLTDDLRRAQKALADVQRCIAEMSDSGELANVKMQQVLDRQAQLLQSVSNIMKSMHDRTKSVISNLR